MLMHAALAAERALHFSAAQLAKDIIVEVSSSAKEEHNPVHCVSVVPWALSAALGQWHDT
jgi:hypothetical protein